MEASTRVVVVTGAGRGIGREIALAFAEEGADLVLTGRSVDQLTAVGKEVEALGRKALVVKADLQVEADVEELASRTLSTFGRVDVLVNNSGIGGPSGMLWELDPADWDETFAVNVRGVFLCCRAFLPSMIQRRSGNIIIIGSMTGKRPLLGRTPYAASKLALVGLARTLALETGPYGIRVNVISPGPVEGPRLDWVIQKQAEARGVSLEEARLQLVGGSPLQRAVSPREVAEAALFLASDKAAAITGEDLNVSAGIVMY